MEDVLYNVDGISNVDFYEPGTTIREIIETKVADTSKREDIDDAFYVVDLGKLESQFKRWQKCLPRVKPFYAIKCNPDATMLRILTHLGAGFDCGSKGEVATALELGVSRNNLIYAQTCKQESHVTFAKQNDVSLMTFDNEDELDKIKKLYPEARLVLRLTTDDYGAFSRLSTKFGCDADEAQYLLMTAKKMNLNVVGVSFHIGSLSGNPESFVKAIRDARRVFDEANEIGFNMEILDIGGGFPGDIYASTVPPFEKFAEVINRELEQNFAANANPGLRIIGEPGRYFAGPVFTLVLNVIARRSIANGNKANGEDTQKPEFRYYLNGSFSNMNFSVGRIDLIPSCLKERKSEELKFLCSTWGQTCSALDCINKQCLMPKLEVGEWVFIKAMGAYTIAWTLKFNGFKIPVCYYVAPKQ